MDLGRYFGSAMALLLLAAALFVAWRCLAIGIARPSAAIVMAPMAALLAGLGWLARFSATRHRPQKAIAAFPSAVDRSTAGPKTEGGEPVEPAADVMQQLTLRTTAEGGKELSGWLRMPLTAGQHTGTLHVAFCPPFASAPQVEAELVSGPDCRIKAAEPMPHGVRLDIKLDSPAAEGESVLVWLFVAAKALQEK